MRTLNETDKQVTLYMYLQTEIFIMQKKKQNKTIHRYLNLLDKPIFLNIHEEQ